MIEEAVEFLRKVPPFQFLDERALRRVAEGAALEYFPKGTLILRQDGPPSAQLMAIKKGGVKVFVRSDDEEVVIDYRSEGDVFGFLSLVTGDKSRANVVAVEDTIVYQLDRAAVLEALEANPAFAEHYVKSFLTKFLDRAVAGMHGAGVLAGAGEKLLFATPVGELASREVVTAPADTPVVEAARLMSLRRVSSLVVVDAAAAPAGIVTDRDLRDKVVARGGPVTGAVREIMSAPIIRIDAARPCFEALVAMIRHNIHHLVVVAGERLAGVVTNHDLMVLQGTSPLSLARDLESQESLAGVVAAAGRIRGLVALLLREATRAAVIAQVVSEFNDRLVRKLIQLAERDAGRPPLPWCWVVFGSAGRREQVFRTDQDNGIVYADPPGPAEEAAARAYFGRLAAAVGEALVRVGFPECPDGNMAREARWCRPLADWKRSFTEWAARATAEDARSAAILFDLRPVAGAEELAGELRAHALAAAGRDGALRRRLAEQAAAVRPPLGFLKGFVVLKDGEHKDRFDLKRTCLAPLVGVVRVLALEAGVAETSTLGRLAALRGRSRVADERGEELEQAFEFLLHLRIRHQLAQVDAGGAPDDFIDPAELSNLEKKIFREVCQTLARAEDALLREGAPNPA